LSAALVSSILLLVIAVLYPPGLGAPADFENLPAEAVAPWFFIWVQELLRLGQPFQMGILIPTVLLVILALLPYILDSNPQGVARWFNREGRCAQLAVLVMLALVLGLTLKNVLQ
jgi:quinol-cytochrome oxidoreductase complex cytochrome b subunit